MNKDLSKERSRVLQEDVQQFVITDLGKGQ
jgi:hypothetical protein